MMYISYMHIFGSFREKIDYNLDSNVIRAAFKIVADSLAARSWIGQI